MTAGHKNTKNLQYQINEELSKVDNWLKINRPTVNIAESNYLVFTNRNAYKEFNIFISNQRLAKQNTIRYISEYILMIN